MVNQDTPRSVLVAGNASVAGSTSHSPPERSSPEPVVKPVRHLHRGLIAARTVIVRNFALLLTFTAVVAGILTFLLMSGSSGVTTDPDTMLALLALDLALLLALGGVVVWRLAKLWAERRAGAAGARLHVKLVSLFTAIAITPAIVVVVLAAIFFSFEVQSWFNERVRTAVTESVAVAEAYLREHKQVIGADALAMAKDLNRQWWKLYGSPGLLNRFVETQANLRALNEAVVLDQSGRLFAETGFSLTLRLERPPPWALEEASHGELVIITSETDDRVRALVSLDILPPAFLYVGRSVDPRVLGHMERAKQAAGIYEQMESRRLGIQAAFATVFILVTLMLLVAAVIVGLNSATSLAHSISGLITAAEEVRAGNMDVRVPESEDESVFGSLIRAFNRMTGQLSKQRSELIEANRQLDDRRRFTETVLSGVSAGVIGLDGEGRINLPNRLASELLSTELDSRIGQYLGEVVPEFEGLIEAGRSQPKNQNEAQITLTKGKRRRTLLVHVAAELGPGSDLLGLVVTFDDITDLLVAQREAAWSDVARRIAHEIKNPLTPIQLSAERLKRKYLDRIGEDRDTFQQCTDTIIRQVSDIGRLVDGFSSFARMPAPVLLSHDLSKICQDAIFLQRTANPDIRYTLQLPDQNLQLRCDRGLISQALTNLLKNAFEAIQDRPKPGQQELPLGEISLTVVRDRDNTVLEVGDNGRGLPEVEPERLVEPYVTGRVKGSGLGLAIVKKIMEDHAGKLVLERRKEGGALVKMVFNMSMVGDLTNEGSLESDTSGIDGLHDGA